VYREADSATSAPAALDATGAEAAPLVVATPPASLLSSPQPARIAVATSTKSSRNVPPSCPSNFIDTRLAFRLIPKRSGDDSNDEQRMTITQRVVLAELPATPLSHNSKSNLRPEALRPRLAAGLPFTLRS
jgi:hypothetical protein